MYIVFIFSYYVGKDYRISRMEFEGLCVQMQELHNKIDMLITSQGRLSRILLPKESKIQKPVNFPNLPVKTKNEFDEFETFLENDGNVTNAVSNHLNIIFFFYKKYCQHFNLKEEKLDVFDQLMTSRLLSLKYLFNLIVFFSVIISVLSLRPKMLVNLPSKLQRNF